MEVRELGPHARLVDAEDREIFGLDPGDVRLVRDCECAPLEIVKPERVHRAARKLAIVAWTRVVALTDIGMSLR